MRKRTTSPRLQTKRLILRALQPEDEDDVCTLAGDRRIAVTTYRIPHPYESRHFRDWLDLQAALQDQGAGLNWAVVRSDDRQFIGAIGLDIKPDDDRAELGYWIGVPHWNQGYGTEAATAVLQFAFNRLELNRIEAHHMTRNPASGRILQRIGMHHEGTLCEFIKKWGVFEDVEIYGLVREQYRETMLRTSESDDEQS